MSQSPPCVLILKRDNLLEPSSVKYYFSVKYDSLLFSPNWKGFQEGFPKRVLGKASCHGPEMFPDVAGKVSWKGFPKKVSGKGSPNGSLSRKVSGKVFRKGFRKGLTNL